jgi:fatty acid CoA ligase FadD36
MHRIVGRTWVDNIKCGGYEVGAGEVEVAIMDVEGIVEFAVVVVDGAVDEHTIINHVAPTLSAHKRPRRVAFVPELPRNALGKVQKNALAKPIG